MIRLSALTWVAAALIATDGGAIARPISGHGRMHTRLVAKPRASLRFGAMTVGQRRWVGPDRPIVSHDERPAGLLGKESEPDRVLA